MWPPGSADTVCPRPPLMTQVQHSRQRRLRLFTWPCNLDLWSGRSWRLWRIGSSSSTRIPSLKFVGLAIRKIWHTMYVSINGSRDPDLWQFDLETGMRVASKVRNLPSKFGHPRPLGSRIIRYVRDGQTDGQKQRLLPPSYGRGIINEVLLFSLTVLLC